MTDERATRAPASAALVDFAYEEALRLGHGYLGTEHLLLALMRDAEGRAARLLGQRGASAQRVRALIEAIVGFGDPAQAKTAPSPSPLARHALELASSEARRHGRDVMQGEDLLIGLVAEADGLAAGVLATLGIDADELHTTLTSRAPGSSSTNQAIISYSHRDQRWLEALQEFLTPLARSGALIAWDDRRIQAGARWREEIETAIASAKVGILLVSQHFIASEFIATHELPPLLRAAEQGRLRIVWIAVSASNYDYTPLADIQCANDPKRPLDRLRPAEAQAVLKRVSRTILDAVR
jgi:hypothetical protein